MAQDSTDIAKSLYASFRHQNAESVLDLFADDAILHGLPHQKKFSHGEVPIIEGKVLNNSSSY